MNACYRLVAVLSLASVSAPSPAQDNRSVTGLRAQAIQALSVGDKRIAIENADAMVRLAPEDPQTTREAADIFLRAGEYRWALRLFDRYLKSEKDDLPELWQRGIALYFAGQYESAAKQFEVHRAVNPNDVENAAWHFLCLAKAESPSEARAKLLPAPGDARAPMEEVLKMLKTGDQTVIAKKIESMPVDSKERKSAQFYGDFYLGLYADAMGRPDEARKFMDKSAKQAPNNYMGDVAKVYAKYLRDR